MSQSKDEVFNTWSMQDNNLSQISGLVFLKKGGYKLYKYKGQ